MKVLLCTIDSRFRIASDLTFPTALAGHTTSFGVSKAYVRSLQGLPGHSFPLQTPWLQSHARP